MSAGRDLLHLLQLNGGTFPTGGFSQSWGLETYVSEGRVRDKNSFEAFLKTYLRSSVALSEGPVLCRSYELWEMLKKEGGKEEAAGDRSEEICGELRELEDLSNAMKVTGESRESSLRIGKAFGRIVMSMIEDEMKVLQNIFSDGEEIREGAALEISYPVIYGCVCSILDIDLADAVRGYIFSAANTLSQSALKLIPLGNAEAQQVLFEARDLMEDCCCLCMNTPLEEVTNFCPGIDIASLKHEELPVRLYMS